MPNIEFRLASTRYHTYSTDHGYEVVLNNRFRLRIAPLELQIAYKLWLGSEKDIGDAAFLYNLFKPVLKSEELRRWCAELNVDIAVISGRANR